MIAKYSEKTIRETLCEMIIVDEMPFSTIEECQILYIWTP
jgi:hypothetical protein